MKYSGKISEDYLQRVSKVLIYIEKNLFSPLSLEEMASEANFSTFHFHRIFFSILGETPVQYQRRIRMENSAKELYNSGTAINEISAKYGFSSPAVYSRDFKKHFGKSPLNLRRKLLSRVITDKEIYNVEIKNILSFTFAYTKITGFNQIIPAFIKLKSVLKKNSVKSEKIVEYIFDNQYITPKGKCMYEIGSVVPDKTNCSSFYNLKKTDNRLYAVYNLKGNTHKIDDCYDNIFSWLIRSEYETDDSPLLIIFKKIYSIRPLLPIDYTDADICVPIKKQELHRK